MAIQSYISPTFFDAKIQTLNTALAGLSIVNIYPLCQVGISEGSTFPECYRNDGGRISERIYPEGTSLSFFLLNGNITTIEDDYDFSVPLSLFVWADLVKAGKTASELIQEVAKRLKSNSCNDLTIQTENVFSEFSDLEKLRFQNVMYPYFAFRVDFTCMLQICVNAKAGVNTPPVLQSLILTSPNTIEITYDKALNESIIPALTDYQFTWLPLLLDLDGNAYNEVTIGNQVWIEQNLKVTKYADGSAIPVITDDATWAADTAGAMCYYNNDEATYKATYGGLYNWYAATNVKGLAKLTKNGVDQNYRVATKTDWDNLSTELGGDAVAGGKLKEMGLAHWLTPNTGATNESEFTGLPGGLRFNDGSFASIGSHGYWQSSTEYVINSGFIMYLRYNYTLFNIGAGLKKLGTSIRLVKDLV